MIITSIIKLIARRHIFIFDITITSRHIDIKFVSRTATDALLKGTKEE